MARRLLALCLALTSATPTVASAAERREHAPAPSEYRLWIGARHEGELLTADVLTAGRLALRGVDAAESAIVPSRARAEPAAIALRFAGLALVDLPIASYTIVVPHEAFGHAARFRELGGRPRVTLDLPLPFSLRADHHVEDRPTRLLYGGEQSVALLGGLAAEEASQRMLVWSTFRARTLRRGEALLYSATALTHAAQTLAGRDLELASTLVRPLYGGEPARYRTFTRAALVLDLIDPMLLYSWYVASVRWLARGEQASSAPSLTVAGARVLATSRTMPVPWGVEHELHLLAALPFASFDLGLRTGAGARGSFGAELATIGWRVLRVMRLGGELAFWAQPLVASKATLGPSSVDALFAADTDAVRGRTTAGGAVRVLFEVEQPSWFLGTRLGWKSAGLWGERELTAGFDVALTGGIVLE